MLKSVRLRSFRTLQNIHVHLLPGMNNPLWDAFPVEVADLFEKIIVLKCCRPSIPDGSHILVVSNRMPLPIR